MFNSKHKPIGELFGLPDPPGTGRRRLVHAAIELFYSRGFQAVALDQVIAAAGVTRRTFCKHFESKDDVLEAAIRQRDEWEMQAGSAAVDKLAGDDRRQKLLALFDVLDVWFNLPDLQGCQFINAAAELPNPYDPVHKVAAEHKRKTETTSATWPQRQAVPTRRRSPIAARRWWRGRSSYVKTTVATMQPR